MGPNERPDGVSELETYETPALTDYGTIESWTQGTRQSIDISIIIN
ncbi:MAG: hypothetical protein ACRDZU_12090 [Acidimicrobiales bacterium]